MELLSMKRYASLDVNIVMMMFFRFFDGYSGANYWNNLPGSCKTEGISLQQFRALLRDGGTKQ